MSKAGKQNEEKIKKEYIRLEGQNRNHYGSAAALAAALGEVKASRGDIGAKEKLLLKYREEFPRHSALHSELREYGMPDMRKGRRR